MNPITDGLRSKITDCFCRSVLPFLTRSFSLYIYRALLGNKNIAPLKIDLKLILRFFRSERSGLGWLGQKTAPKFINSRDQEADIIDGKMSTIINVDHNHSSYHR